MKVNERVAFAVAGGGVEGDREEGLVWLRQWWCWWCVPELLATTVVELLLVLLLGWKYWIEESVQPVSETEVVDAVGAEPVAVLSWVAEEVVLVDVPGAVAMGREGTAGAARARGRSVRNREVRIFWLVVIGKRSCACEVISE